MNRLDKIEARADAATKGPWVCVLNGDESEVTYANAPITWDDHGGEVFTEGDAEFIAHARTDVPWLLEQVERRDKALEAVLDLHKEDGHGWGPGESFCTECQQGYGLLVPYPCPTVAAIRQHLGDDL